LNTSDIPLPVEYGGQIRELISDSVSSPTHVPLSHWHGHRSPRADGERPAFWFDRYVSRIWRKMPTGNIRVARVAKIGASFGCRASSMSKKQKRALGQIWRRYCAVEFARAEDTWVSSRTVGNI